MADTPTPADRRPQGLRADLIAGGASDEQAWKLHAPQPVTEWPHQVRAIGCAQVRALLLPIDSA